LFDIIKSNINKGFYDKEILELYTVEEINELDAYIKHDRDNLLTYAAMEQFRGKYLVQNRATKQIFETPQVAYIMIAATLFGRYPKETRMQYVKDFYDSTSTFDISLPTPIMAGVRTPPPVALGLLALPFGTVMLATLVSYRFISTSRARSKAARKVELEAEQPHSTIQSGTSK